MLLKSGMALAAALLCGGWTFTLMHKPGSMELAQALIQRDAGNYTTAGALLHEALGNAIDEETEARALTELGALIIHSRLAEKPPADGIPLLEKAAALDNFKAVYLLGEAYHHGLGVTPDKSYAGLNYERIAEHYPQALLELAELHAGHTSAAYYFHTYLARVKSVQLPRNTLQRIARIYEEGKIIPRDSTQAERYFHFSAAGDPAQYYRTGRYYEKRATRDSGNARQALIWFRQAAALGHPQGLLKLARAYRDGALVSADITHARRLYRQAATAGSAKAATELAGLDARKKKPPKISQDYAYWRSNAEKGDVEAMRELGICLMHGMGVTRDPAEAMRWLTGAAEEGDIPAMRALARAYSSGIGARYNITTSYAWLMRAAEAGDAEAQYLIGLAHARGNGLKRNASEARRWLTRAHDNGNPLAKSLLNTLTITQMPEHR